MQAIIGNLFCPRLRQDNLSNFTVTTGLHPPPSPTPQISSTYSHLNDLIMHSSSLWSGYIYLGYNIRSFSKVMTSSNIRSR